MRRTWINFWIDVVAFLCMLGMMMTGWVIRYSLPAGSGGHGRGAAWTLWGWDRHDWGDLHFWLAVGTVTLLLVHVVLHWGWFCATMRSLLPEANQRSGRLGLASRTVLGTSVLLLLIGAFGLFAWVAGARVSKPTTAQASPRWGAALGGVDADDVGATISPGQSDEGHEIRGYMTLEQVATTSGVSIHDLKQRLGLPDSVSDQERIGQLRRARGLEVSGVRAAVADLKAAAAR